MCKLCPKPSRRHVIAGIGTLSLGAALVGPSRLAMATDLKKPSFTPDEALAKLKEGNAKYLSSSEECEKDLAKHRKEEESSQAPWATILTCSDSRVVPELIFGGLNLGEIFVCRNAGNIADDDMLGTIEYGAEHLGSSLVVVMGHQHCGAVTAACNAVQKGEQPGGFIGKLVGAITPAAEVMMGKDGDFVANTVLENARRNAETILTASEVVKDFVTVGKLKVIYATYDIDTGVVEFHG